MLYIRLVGGEGPNGVFLQKVKDSHNELNNNIFFITFYEGVD